ncbi:hypothetical protein, partial [Klebsiella pneumoniae]|uniref:hypothetical protein n=1 Tax=Klebsiella pneumoniae TaxID=573 RepID=UPI001A9359D5
PFPAGPCGIRRIPDNTDSQHKKSLITINTRLAGLSAACRRKAEWSVTANQSEAFRYLQSGAHFGKICVAW